MMLTVWNNNHGAKKTRQSSSLWEIEMILIDGTWHDDYSKVFLKRQQNVRISVINLDPVSARVRINFWTDGFFSCVSSLHGTMKILLQIALMFIPVWRTKGASLGSRLLPRKLCKTLNDSGAYIVIS